MFLFSFLDSCSNSPSLGKGLKICLACECYGNHLALEILNTPKADYGDADPTILKESLLHCSNDGLDKIACTDTKFELRNWFVRDDTPLWH